MVPAEVLVPAEAEAPPLLAAGLPPVLPPAPPLLLVEPHAVENPNSALNIQVEFNRMFIALLLIVSSPRRNA